MRLRIENADDAKSTARKYIVDPRSRHGKNASITIGEDRKGPDDKDAWTIRETYLTEEGDMKEFAALVTHKGNSNGLHCAFRQQKSPKNQKAMNAYPF